ncbi:TadE/TadG family type IV pilus assembly protein [Neomegalonema sp.]|uniref:TadE/TadG family type IV pilus assembly protein n=1 Tax=Neomegalonema sp. TaxID=2039713 RepID=UPI00260E321B|nr:TadE/TadG family type IV pilus assembly protein [Neomegalonema sp.]MDD2868918.1 TadE/TadG family type IV pilus assembly protein [Neomegalonema sp.]
MPIKRPDLRLLRRFRRSRRGIAALEFALLSPLLVLLLLGSTEVTHLIWASGRLNATTASVGNVLTQERTLTNASFGEIVGSSPTVMAPYGNASLKFQVISAVACYQAGAPTTPIYVVSWSRGWDGAQANSASYLGQTGQYPVATRLNSTDLSHLLAGMALPPGDSVIIVRGEFTYEPKSGLVMGGLLAGSSVRHMKKYVTYQPRIARRLYFEGVESNPQKTCETGLLMEG